MGIQRALGSGRFVSEFAGAMAALTTASWFGSGMASIDLVVSGEVGGQIIITIPSVAAATFSKIF